MMRAFASLMVAALLLSGCASTQQSNPDLPRGTSAYDVIPAIPDERVARDYKIGALDSIDVAVFQEPELSLKAAQVDAAGNIAIPLIGPVQASGKTATELARELEQRLGERYLEKPQVTVSIAGSVSQKVIVQGQVEEPGVYEIKGPTTLLEAMSLAKGETRIAALEEVVIFRTVNGQRMGAVFDVASIRRGDFADPEVLGNDVIVVGYSNAKSLWRDIVGAAPILNVFRPLGF